MSTTHESAVTKPLQRLPSKRAWNIIFRTAHLGVGGILLGGHVFGVERERLLIWLYLTIATGVILTGIEAFPRWRWCYEGRGVLVIAKLLLLCLVPWFWDQRALLLAAVVIIASVGSHMPGRFRYFSVVHGRVLDDHRKPT